MFFELINLWTGQTDSWKLIRQAIQMFFVTEDLI